MARKAKETVKKAVKKVEKVAESTISREISEEEQQVVDEQDRQKRVANCTVAVQQALRESNCELDVTVILRAGQVIPRISIVPVEVLQAQRNAQQPV
jgi:2-oxoglutarate dehydrogenase complex dehydrogenase (E1) component-like enzyme